MATFPAYAKILLAGFSEEADYGVLRSEMDGGIAKQRPTRTKAIVTREVQIIVYSKADRLQFDTWSRVDLNSGTAWFDWLDPVDGVTKKTRIVGGKYKWTKPAPVWLASCSIETIG